MDILFYLLSVIYYIVLCFSELSFKTCNKRVDWSQFIPGVLETFIGVIIALIFQKIYEDIKENKEANKQKLRIKNELINILDDLTQIQENNIMVLNPIKMPIFQGLKNSAKLSLLERFVWYDEMLSVYNELSSYVSWCEFRLTHCKNENIDTTDNIIKKMEIDFLGKSHDDSQVCQYTICPICTNCKLENIKLKGSVKCLIAKVSVINGTDKNTFYGKIKRFMQGGGKRK